jgi:uncharacterized protein YjbI with pentapeptide repeats
MLQISRNGNLRGRNFSDQKLTGEDFSHADIRGAKFTNAILTNADFSHARAGLEPHWILLLIMASLFLAMLSGVATGIAGILGSGMLQSYFMGFEGYGPIPGLIVLGAIAIFIIFTVRHSFLSGLVTMVVSLASISAVIGTLAGVLPGVGMGALVMAFVIIGTLATAIAVGVSVAVTEARNWIVYALGATSLTVTIIVVQAAIANITTHVIEARNRGISPELEKAFNEFLRSAYGTYVVPRALYSFLQAGAIAVVLAVAIAGSLLCLGIYVGWYSLSHNAKDDRKFTFTRKIILAIAAIGGTNFQGSTLTDANFTKAILKNTDLRGAEMIGTSWFLARGLERARVGESYLQNPRIRRLVTTGAVSREENERKFDGLSLRGVNLISANLANASLIGADLSEANLYKADLSGVKLIQTQLDRANLMGTTLTGAYIQDWNITSGTQLKEVNCNYVYMGLPTDPDPYRKPDNYEENFEIGDFEDFIKPLVETLDLYHSRGIDPRAFAIAFNQLVENHPDGEIEIVAMERRGSDLDKFLVRARTSPRVNRSQLHAEYFSDYNRLNALSARNLLLELAQRDHQISMLTGMVANLTKRSDLEVSPPYRLGKRVVLNIVDGSFERGFSVILQIGEDGALPSVEIPGRLPASREIQKSYEKWRFLLRDLQIGRLETADVHLEIETKKTEEPQVLRLEAPEAQIVNVSITEDVRDIASELEGSINEWLNSDLFRPLREKLLERLNPSDEIRVLIQTDDRQLRRLPWHVWSWFKSYRKAEIALSSTTYGKANYLTSTRNKIRILAVLGDRQGINVDADRQLLEQLSQDMEIVLLDEPTREQLDKMLWDERGWDILFFAGHSNSQLDDNDGFIRINSQEKLTIGLLDNALQASIERGLKLAIFNSCDGLGLAKRLASLHIPQIIVMREPIPDRVAQKFLQNFLAGFSQGKSLYMSVREAREQLQGLESDFPCATWLPVICQNLAEIPWTWQEYRGVANSVVKELLAQLQAAIATDLDLTDRNKAAALEQVDMLAGAGQFPTEHFMQGLAQQAIGILREIMENEIPITSQLSKDFERLLAAIAQELQLS